MINRIRADIKTAMLNKDNNSRDVLKMVLDKANANAKEKKIEVPTNDMVIDAINKERKQIKQTLDILVKNKKEDSDLYKESIIKYNLLETYLPKQMSEDEIKDAISKIIVEKNLDTKNKGLIMKNVMPVLKGKADGKFISSIVNSL